MMPLIGCQTKTEVDDTPLNQEVVESFWVLGFFLQFLPSCSSFNIFDKWQNRHIGLAVVGINGILGNRSHTEVRYRDSNDSYPEIKPTMQTWHFIIID